MIIPQPAHVALGLVLSVALVANGAGAATASPRVDNSSTSGAVIRAESEDLRLTAAQLAAVGLSRADAERATSAVRKSLDDAVAAGALSREDAEGFAAAVLVEGASRAGAQPRVLPIWAAAAIAGCAASVVTGEGKTQVKNALKNGTVDSATDIAIGIGVDGVFGAVPLGALTAALKAAVGPAVKTALRPLVKKIVEKFKKDEGE